MTGSVRNHSPVCATNVERSVTVKLTPDEHDRLAEIAKIRRTTKAALVRGLVRKFVAFSIPPSFE